ncbi:MAG: hypothetical protein KDB61_05365 [Planctomycetes bacterium]|nr:hypothetical protein [Planctomycetota bacterium]
MIEIMLSVAILGVLARSLIQVSASMGSLSQSGGSQSLLQQEASKVQETLIQDLRRSGYMMVDGLKYPHVFEDGQPGFGFEDQAYQPATQEAAFGQSDFGLHRAVVFLQPSDLDGDRRPDMDLDLNGVPELDGNRDGVFSEQDADLGGWDADSNRIDPNTGLVWSTAKVCYAVLDGPDGRTYLERRVGGLLDRRVAKDVERLLIETPAETGFQIPTNSLRVSLYLRRKDSDGVTYKHFAQWVVTLQNGDLE